MLPSCAWHYLASHLPTVPILPSNNPLLTLTVDIAGTSENDGNILATSMSPPKRALVIHVTKKELAQLLGM